MIYPTARERDNALRNIDMHVLNKEVECQRLRYIGTAFHYSYLLPPIQIVGYFGKSRYIIFAMAKFMFWPLNFDMRVKFIPQLIDRSI